MNLKTIARTFGGVLAVSALLVPQIASAKATTIHNEIDTPIVFTTTDTCTGNALSINAMGKGHLAVTTDSSGGAHLQFSVSIHGDASSIDGDYIVNGSDHQLVNANSQGQMVSTFTVRLTIQNLNNASDTLSSDMVTKAVVNADGTQSVNYFSQTATCLP